MCTTWASAANSGCKVVWRPGEPPGGHLWRVGRHWGPDLNRSGVPVPDHRPLTINPQHRSKRTSSKYGIWGKSRLRDCRLKTRCVEWRVKFVLVLRKEGLILRNSIFFYFFLSSMVRTRAGTSSSSLVLSCHLLVFFLSVEKPARRSL